MALAMKRVNALFYRALILGLLSTYNISGCIQSSEIGSISIMTLILTYFGGSHQVEPPGGYQRANALDGGDVAVPAFGCWHAATYGDEIARIHLVCGKHGSQDSNLNSCIAAYQGH